MIKLNLVLATLLFLTPAAKANTETESVCDTLGRTLVYSYRDFKSYDHNMRNAPEENWVSIFSENQEKALEQITNNFSPILDSYIHLDCDVNKLKKALVCVNKNQKNEGNIAEICFNDNIR